MRRAPLPVRHDLMRAALILAALLLLVVVGLTAKDALTAIAGQWWVVLLILAQGLVLIAGWIGRELYEATTRHRVLPTRRLEETARRLPRIHDLSHLLTLTTRLLVRCLQASHATLYLQEVPTGGYRLVASEGSSAPPVISQVDASSPLIQWFLEHRKPLRPATCTPSGNGARLGPKANPYHRLRFVLENLKAELIVPSFQGKHLMGFLVLGPRLTAHHPYREAEVTALVHLAEECAIAVDNANSYATLQATTQKLQTTKDRLVQQERMVTAGRFAMGLAHEIKNPLAAIKTFTEYLPERHDDPAFREEFSHVVGKEVDRINRIVQSLSDFAKPLPIKVETLEIQRLLHDTVTLLSNDCLKRAVTLREECESDPILLPADPNQLKQAILNLCLNALDAMPQGGALTIGCRLEAGEAILTIRDTGCGIPSEELPRLFDPFFTTKTTGMGLGLAVVKQIVDQHAGTIEVESSLGQGTTLTLRLPLAVRLSPRAQSEGSGNGSAPAVATWSPPSTPAASSLQGLELLVVDDEPRIREMLKGCAEAWGCQVRSVASGEEALRAVSERVPQLVLLDLALEALDGFEVLKRLKLAYPQLRVVIVTQSEDPLVEQHVQALGATACLHKPIDVALLKQRLAELTQQAA